MKQKNKKQFLMIFFLFSFLLQNHGVSAMDHDLEEVPSQQGEINALRNKLDQDDILIISLSDQVKEADSICHGFIEDISYKYESYNERISLMMSRFFLNVRECWKGNLSSKQQIRGFGGYEEGRPYFARQFPRFHEGEEVVLFLKNHSSGIYTARHKQGKKRVENGEVVGTQQSLGDYKRHILELLKSSRGEIR